MGPITTFILNTKAAGQAPAEKGDELTDSGEN